MTYEDRVFLIRIAGAVQNLLHAASPTKHRETLASCLDKSLYDFVERHALALKNESGKQ